MSVRIRDNSAMFNLQLAKITADGIARATAFYHSRCKLTVNVPNSGVRTKVKRRTKGGNKSSKTTYPNPSKPGEPPRKRTGWGQRHIMMEINRNQRVGRVGIAKNAIYMLYLELGTRRIKPRPWLVATLRKHQKMIGTLAVKGG